MKTRNFKIISHLFILGTFAMGLIACGGGGGAPATLAPAVPPVTISGTVTYTDYDIGAAGIIYTSEKTKAIRGAVVELRNSVGTVLLASANTSETGGYTFSAPANQSVSIVVKAALGTPAAPDTKVLDNTNSDALYALTKAVTTTTSNVTENFNAGSGYDGSSYTGLRASAPFAILDVIHQGRLFVLAADPTVVFPPLTVQWSAKNKTVANGDIKLGDGPGTSYNAPNLWLNGAPDLDTDEYDSTVIAHEWGHYVQEKLSASHSPGGDHTLNDILHPSLAFDEGFATAMGSMIMNDTTQINTLGAKQATGSVLTANIEADSVTDTDKSTAPPPPDTAFLLDGIYAEVSIIEIMWDLFDSGVNGAADDDNVALGFVPIFKVMTNGHKNTDALTSIYSFIHFLKLEVPASKDAIDVITGAENIDTVGADEYEKTPDSLYDLVTIDTPKALRTFNFFGPATEANLGGNKLFNFRYLKSTIPAQGCYTFTATPTGAAAATTDLVFAIGGVGTLNNNPVGVPEVLSVSLDPGPGVIQVGAFSDNALFSFTYALASSPTLCN